MSASMAGQIAQLRTFSRQQLLDMWRKLYERAAPPGIRRELLVPFLAYRMQEHAYERHLRGVAGPRLYASKGLSALRKEREDLELLFR
jgi:hypothetical protein